MGYSGGPAFFPSAAIVGPGPVTESPTRSHGVREAFSRGIRRREMECVLSRPKLVDSNYYKWYVK